MARRSTTSSGSSRGAPCTWERKPSSAYLSARTMPDLASRRLASTSCVLLPMDETMPIPVTTTRLMPASSASHRRAAGRQSQRSGPARLQHRLLTEQPDLEIERTVDHRAVGGKPAVGDAEHELRSHHPLDVEAVHDLLHRRQHLAGKLEFAEPERATLAGRAEPAEEKAEQLPQRVEAEAAGHHRVALEVARKKPKVRLHVELGAHQALAVLPALFGDLGNAIEHQHRRQWQLRIALAEQLAPGARQQMLEVEAQAPGLRCGFSRKR